MNDEKRDELLLSLAARVEQLEAQVAAIGPTDEVDAFERQFRVKRARSQAERLMQQAREQG